MPRVLQRGHAFSLITTTIIILWSQRTGPYSHSNDATGLTRGPLPVATSFTVLAQERK